MNGLVNIYSKYINKSIEINKIRAKSNKEDFNEKKKELLDKIIKNINENSRNIIDNYLNLLTDMAASSINNSRFKYKIDITAKTNSRLLINTAASLGITVFEVGVNIHPLFGIPYIPSSSIKGSLRSYIHNNYPDKEYIFGNQERIGDLLVLDAFPISYDKRLVDGEVTTPIYGSGDIEQFKEHKVSPNPIIYPCIAKGVTFRFIVAFNDDKLKKEILEYFSNMLREGIGAKTLVGYGEFNDIKVINDG